MDEIPSSDCPACVEGIALNADGTAVRNYRDVVDNVEIAWIPMPDGRRLAARLLLPKTAAKSPVPAILEYIPYRRRDGTRPRDDDTHYWFAANGYGSARVDISGSGDSEGLIEDEYIKREQDDALAIIAWLAKQPWCTGAVGMIGISWGGFNGLQVAARRPPALKAVISLCATVDRYHDDVRRSERRDGHSHRCRKSDGAASVGLPDGVRRIHYPAWADGNDVHHQRT